MKLFDKIFSKQNIIIHRIENKDNTLNSKLEKEPIERITEKLKDFATAITNAEDKTQDDSTRYYDLLSLCRNIELDEHVSSVTDKILFKVTQNSFNLLDKNGNVLEKEKVIFENIWFYDFIKYALESDYYPFGLLQLVNPNENGFEKVECIDRFYVRPTLGSVSKQKWNDYANFDYTKKPLKDACIFIQSQKEFGRYAIIAKRFILKREILQYWAVFNELFTTPYVTVKTNFNDSKHRNDLLNWLKGRKHSGFAVVGLEDEIEQMTSGGSGWNSYQAFEQSANDAISKAFLGQTMTTSNGSSRSQAEVHERVEQTFINAKMQWLKYIINGELLPRMANYGIIKDCKFNWDMTKTMSQTELVDAVNKLSTSFKFDEEQISEKIGLTLTEKNDIPSQNNFGSSK